MIEIRRTNVFDGVRALWFGVDFLARHRELWQVAAVPALLTIVLSVGFGIGGSVLAATAVLHQSAIESDALLWLLAFLAGVGAFGLGLLLGISLAVPLSGAALERIARAVCTELNLPLPEVSGVGAALSSLGAVASGLLLGMPAVLLLTLVGLLVPPLAVVTVPLKIAVLALLVTWDVADHTFALYGMGLREREKWMRANLNAVLSFGWLAGLLLCVPLVGLLCLPAGVAGAAHLVAQTKR